jgi:hypothetical protein
MPRPEVDAWFDSAPESQRRVLSTLRALVQSIGPGIAEELKWGRPCYSTQRGLFCYLHSTKNHATLGFQQGTSLSDPLALLEGTGKDMRHIKFSASAELNEPAVLALLRQAAGR